MKATRKLIAIDFDGTTVMHDFPYIGEEVPHAIEVLKKLQSAGHDFILYTMRSNNLVDEAEEWLRNRGIFVSYVNCNPEMETGSRKCYAHAYVDDHGIGTPLIYDPDIHKKPFVNWLAVEKLFIERGYL
jgi:hypothetical protein